MKRAAVIGTRPGGIGEAIASVLRADGLHVMEGNSKNCDVTDPRSIESFMGMAMLSEPTTVLVNAFGAEPSRELLASRSHHDIEHTLRVDLLGTILVCRQWMKYGVPRGGRIVNVSSYHALGSYPNRSVYAAAKAGVVGFTQALALDLAPYFATANCILPGQVISSRSSKLLSQDEQKKIIERAPMGGIPNATNIADAVKFLVSPEAQYINGHSLVIDGGWSKDFSW